jgi:hypothetical protein
LRSADRSDVAEAKPPTKKNSGITWPIQVIQPYSGEKSRRLPPTSSPWSSTATIPTQCPRATTTIAAAR